MADNKRQYFLHDDGEYECPHYILLDERYKAGRYADDSDRVVYLTEAEAKMYRDIADLAAKAEVELSRMYWGDLA